MSIKEKLERGIYSIECIPRILHRDHRGIYINKHAPYPDEIVSFENMNWNRDKIFTDKLKAEGDWALEIDMINAKHFESREKMEEMFINKKERILNDFCKTFDRITMKNALRYISAEITPNMNYYLNNQHEMKIDLNHEVSSLDLKNDYELKKLESELFYKLMCLLFGEDEEGNDSTKPENDDTIYKKSFNLKNFCILSAGDDCIFATAKRGSYYLLFTKIY